MQGPASRWRLALHILLVLVVAAVLVPWLSGSGFFKRPEQEVIQEAVIHHFERSSWFALNAEEYERLLPGLGREFRESAEWHARRAREYQRMNPASLAAALEYDATHDRREGQLMDRALKAKIR